MSTIEKTASFEAAGEILSLIALGKARSRADIQRLTGLSRVTITQRLNTLLVSGLIAESPDENANRGRPVLGLEIRREFGATLTADIGETMLRMAITDLGPAVLAEEAVPYRISEGPEAALSLVSAAFDRLLARAGTGRCLLGLGISLPAPVDHRRGRVVGPSVLRGWDEFDVKGWLEARHLVPAIVENDVNLMTIFEYQRFSSRPEQFFFIKAGTGIGSGIISDGVLNRGAQGAAGDIGHIQFSTENAPLCRCGKLGCVEARAAGWALARDLRQIGFSARNARDVVALVEEQTPEAIRLVRDAGRTIGEVTADVVSILNPSAILVGGTLAKTGEYLMSGIRELVYQRCLPLATRELVIATSPPSEEACLVGAAHAVLAHVFDPAHVAGLMRRIGEAARPLRRTG